MVGLALMVLVNLAMGTFDDVNAISKIAVNTHLAGAAGTVTGAASNKINWWKNRYHYDVKWCT